MNRIGVADYSQAFYTIKSIISKFRADSSLVIQALPPLQITTNFIHVKTENYQFDSR
jgi:hypothetical protein